jgi:hypothetical protein
MTDTQPTDAEFERDVQGFYNIADCTASTPAEQKRCLARRDRILASHSALRVENAAISTAWEQATDEVLRLRAEVEEVKLYAGALSHSRSEMQTEIDTLRAEVERLTLLTQPASRRQLMMCQTDRDKWRRKAGTIERVCRSCGLATSHGMTCIAPYSAAEEATKE